MEKLLLLLSLSFSLTACNFLDRVEHKASVINNYKHSALNLAKENRELKAKVSDLDYQVQELKTENNFLKIQIEKEGGRTPASFRPMNDVPKFQSDYVKYDVYKWSPTQLLAIAEKEFKSKNYEKSSQYFHTYIALEREHKTLDDEILFQSGLAAFESGKYFDTAIEHLSRLQKDYPTSKYFRGAKLWTALSHLKQGDQDSFYETVEEFRLKYRNTPEWEILSGHYEELTQKYKK